MSFDWFKNWPVLKLPDEPQEVALTGDVTLDGADYARFFAAGGRVKNCGYRVFVDGDVESEALAALVSTSIPADFALPWITREEPPAFTLVPNPAYEGLKPRIIETMCHDRTPALEIRCVCGCQLHLHESQTKAFGDMKIRSQCHACKAPLEFPPGFFTRAFQRLRDEGWIA